MRASAGRVIYTDDDLPREQMLDTEIPLINFSVTRFARVQAVIIRQTPQGERPIGLSLRLGQTATGKRIFERGESMLEIVLGEANWVAVSKRGSSELEVCRNVQAVVNARASANHSTGIEGVGESQTRGPIVAVHRNRAMAGTGKFSSPEQTRIAGQNSGHIDRNNDAAISCEIAELNLVVPLGIWRTPLVAQTKI